MGPARFAALALAVGGGFGCGAMDEFEETFVDELTVPGTIGPQSPFTADYEGDLDRLDLASSAGFQEAGVTPSQVDSIRVVAGTLRIDSGTPELNDLGRYVERIELHVRSDNEPRALVTRLEPLPRAREVELPLAESPELVPFATDTGMGFEAELRLRRRPPVNIRLTTSLTLRVDVNLLGS
jgi:hypothetical protein